MSSVDIDYLKSWIGRERSSTDLITPRLATSLYAVLDIDKLGENGAPAPAGIHWCIAPDIVPMSGIGPDGHPSRGGYLPPIPFPRRMWAGGSLTFFDRLRVGDEVTRSSTIKDVELKQGKSGALIFVTVQHDYATTRGLALTERQDIVYRKLETTTSSRQSLTAPHEVIADYSRPIDANPVLLFRYSAITFNGHRIHYDEPYVTTEEGYPGLIFHGPLQATLLLGLAVELRNGELPDTFTFRSVRPLFSGGRVSINLRRGPRTTSLWVSDQKGIVAMEASS